MIMCVLLCYPVSIHMSQLLSTGHPISSCIFYLYTAGCSAILFLSTVMMHMHFTILVFHSK